MPASKANRLVYIDYLRCFGILLMVTGHVVMGNGGFDRSLEIWIYSFHMPLFFFISGYFCNPDNDTAAHIIKRCKSLLVPFVVFAVADIVFCGIVRNDWEWGGLFYANIKIPLNKALWFMPALFFTDLIAFLILKYLPEKTAIPILFLIGIFGCFHVMTLPFSIDSALVAVGYFASGYLFKKIRRLNELRLWEALLAIVIGSLLGMLNGKVNMRLNDYSGIILYWPAAIGMTIGFWNLFRILSGHINWPIAAYIGKNSMIYVCLNMFLIYLMELLLPDATGVWLAAKQCFETVIVMVILTVADYYISKTPLKVLLGK